ncbi:SEC10/PgrA surface exclusion domain-containing protein [Streptococcus sp. BJSWXB6CM1]|uniref:SEC10/PgrA surface exclusion domain-containing protein n=2 Tax=Streptococcus TaxID=1301 RepID=A0ABU5FUH6_9STRE|nr:MULTISPECIES: SEC10/PgrA surface exclusion domain-containing protein [unclassified Streptococcus]MDY4345395.1 SEC10/PgrA surface exclusion domain-containing protein [Streptococcus sp. BJSWXB5TM5]MDY4370354.1 SEC10/PgrA surface exclusion domain-containing protein [Streptococcus sp. BJSWXB6CM1]
MEMMKEVKKVLLASAVATAAIGATTQASAEELKPTEPISGGQQKSVTKKTVTETDVAISQGNVEQANSVVQNQEEIVNSNQNEVNDAERVVEKATEAVTQAEKLVQEATPKNIQNAEQIVAEKQDAEKKAQEELSSAEEQQKLAEKNVTDQEASVKKATKKLADKTEEVTDSEQIVAEKQAILDGTGVAGIVANAEAAERNLEMSEKAESQARQELELAKEADDQRASKLKQAEEEVTTTEATRLVKAEELAQATTHAVNAENQYRVAKENLSKAQSILDSLTTTSITYPAGYVEALKAYFNNPTEENSNKLQEIAKKGMTAAGFSSPDGGETYYGNPTSPFKQSEADKKTVIADVNHLSAEVQDELAIFNAHLINDFRRLMGTDDLPVLVNRDMQKVAQKASQLSTNQYGHDLDALNTVAKEVGLNQGNQGLLAENIGFQNADDVVTLADLKQQAYNNMVMMLFYDKHADWGHALNFAGLDRKSVTLQYIGVATRKTDLSLIAMHYVGTDSKTIDLLKNGFHQNVKVDTKNNLASLQERIQVARNSVAQAQDTYETAKTNHKDAQARKEQAQTEYTQAEVTTQNAVTNRNDIQNIALKTPEAEAKLKRAEANLKKASLENKQAQEALEQLNADVQNKREVLALAKDKLAEKQTEWKSLNEALTAEKEALLAKQGELTRIKELVLNRQALLSESTESLKASKERVEVLKNAPQLLEKAKVNLEAAQEVLKEKKSVLELALEKLEIAKAEQRKVLEAHKELLSAYRDYLETQQEIEHQKELTVQKASIEQEGTQSTPVLQNGKTAKYVHEQVAKVKDPVYQAPVATYELPKTGEKSSSLWLLGMVTVSLLSLLKIKRESKEN